MIDLSGKFVLRLPKNLHLQLKKIAEKKSISLNQICLEILKKELTNSIKKTSYEKLVSELKNIFEEDFLGLILFGSTARNEAREDSDTDIMILLSDNTKINRDLYTIWDKSISKKTLNEFTNSLSPHFSKAPQEPYSSIWLEIALDGIIIWEKDFYASNIINKIRHNIASGLYVRKLSLGQAYWSKSE